MPQERSDARRIERELKISFIWREADKNLAKEERNAPLDLNTVNDVMQLETRAWKTNPQGTSLEDAPVPQRRNGNGGNRGGNGGSRPSSNSGGANRTGNGGGPGGFRRRRRSN